MTPSAPPSPPRLPPLPREARLVFLSAGPESDEVRRRMAELIEGGLDWQLVVLLAEREKAVARLYQHLKGGAGAGVPDPVLAHLGRVAQVESFRAMVLEQRMDALLGVLAREGIPVMVLKGAAMARNCYPAFRDRPMGDIDLMVPPTQADAARAAAEAAGWSVVDTIVEEHFPGEVHQHLPPMSCGTALNLGLDLHTRLSGTWEPEGFGPEDLWARAVPLKGADAVAPDPADLLLHVCIHFAWSHSLAFGGWKAFRDAAILLDDPALDLKTFQARVRRARAGSLVWWTLAMAQDMAAVPVPSDLQRAFEPAAPVWVRGRLLRHYASGLCDLAAQTPTRLNRWLWEVGVRPSTLGAGPLRPWSNDEKFHGVRVGGPGSGPQGQGGEGTDSGSPASTDAGALSRVMRGARHLGWMFRAGAT